MDGLVCSVQRGKPTKFKTKPNRKPKPIDSPIKVVYISNPIRVQATASEFRALVQELTGQDSELPDPAKFSPEGTPSAPEDPPRAVPTEDAAGKEKEEEEDDDNPVQEVPAVGPELYHRQPDGAVLFDVDSDDQIFMPQMLENLVELWPSSLLYRS